MKTINKLGGDNNSRPTAGNNLKLTALFQLSQYAKATIDSPPYKEEFPYKGSSHPIGTQLAYRPTTEENPKSSIGEDRYRVQLNKNKTRPSDAIGFSLRGRTLKGSLRGI